MKWYGIGDLNSTERQKCSQRASIIFFTIFLQYFYNIGYNMFARHVFTIAFTIFLAEYFYNVFYKYFNSMFLRYVSPFSFYSFLQCTYTGEDEGSRLTFIYSLRILILFLSLSASNCDYLYYSLLQQGSSLIRLGKGG